MAWLYLRCDATKVCRSAARIPTAHPLFNLALARKPSFLSDTFFLHDSTSIPSTLTQRHQQQPQYIETTIDPSSNTRPRLLFLSRTPQTYLASLAHRTLYIATVSSTTALNARGRTSAIVWHSLIQPTERLINDRFQHKNF